MQIITKSFTKQATTIVSCLVKFLKQFLPHRCSRNELSNFRSMKLMREKKYLLLVDWREEQGAQDIQQKKHKMND